MEHTRDTHCRVNKETLLCSDCGTDHAGKCFFCQGKGFHNDGCLFQPTLECCCCGDDAGNYQQHWNRDTGYGICRRCVDKQLSRGVSAEEILSLYGVEGVNYANIKEISMNKTEIVKKAMAAKTAMRKYLDSK